MTKQFKTKNEMGNYIEKRAREISSVRNGSCGAFEMMYTCPSDEDFNSVLSELEADGYDLENLTEDGSYYEILGHKNFTRVERVIINNEEVWKIIK